MAMCRGKPELKVPEDNGVNDRHVGIEGRQELARERRLIAAGRSIQRIEHVGKTYCGPFKTFQQFVECVLPFLFAPDSIEMIELPSEKKVRSKVARITLRLEPDVLLKSFSNLWQDSVNVSFCKVDGHTMTV